MPPDTKLPLPDDVRAILRRLDALSVEDKRELGESLATADRLTLEKSTGVVQRTRPAPTNDDELHEWIKCAKPDALVRMRAGKRGSPMIDVPIADLKVGDSVPSFDKRYVTAPRQILDVTRTHYRGDLHRVDTADFSTSVTPNHRWFVRLNDAALDRYVVYLMQKGPWFRVGRTGLLRLRNKKQGHRRLGLQGRLAGEQADCAWILKVFSTEEEAMIYEQVVAAQYGFPQLLFYTGTNASPWWNAKRIDAVYSSLDAEIQRVRAHACLQQHGRDIRFPMLRRVIGERGLHSVATITTPAINLIPEVMEIPIPGGRYDEAFWQPIRAVTAEPYVGDVISLNVAQHHRYIQDGMITCNSECGFDIPRVAVCPDHQAPFDFVADAYFERFRAMFLVGSREQGKTLNTSIVHYCNAENRPGVTACTFGAIEEQANRAYAHVKSFIYTIKTKPDGTQEKVLKPQIADTLRRRTDWKTGSAIEILIGSKSGVNSPHPNKVHADEVDLMDTEVWNESRNMASGSVINGQRIKPQDFATSTLKSNNGPVAAIIKECEEAEAQGFKPPWKIYRSCIFECAAEVPHCQCAPDDKRRERLVELGQDPETLCACDRVVKGEWAEDNPRTLASVCKGNFFRSRGWMDHDDVVGKFMQNVKVVWDAQMECRRPMADGLYLPGWSRERFTVKGWLPRPEYGRVFTGTDWGGGAESAILWCQYIVMPVQVLGAGGTMVIVPADSIVVFDELLKAGTGATKLASEVLARESGWRQRVPGFRVAARFADMAGRQQRDDWREHQPPLRTVWYLSSRDFDPQVECLQDLVEDKLYWADIERCSRHVDDIEGWRQKGGREVHDETSHSMAASRYMTTNIVTRSRRFQNRKQSREIDPAVAQREEGSIVSPVAAMPGARGPGPGFDAERRWRAEVGQSFPNTTRGPGPWQQ